MKPLQWNSKDVIWQVSISWYRPRRSPHEFGCGSSDKGWDQHWPLLPRLCFANPANWQQFLGVSIVFLAEEAQSGPLYGVTTRMRYGMKGPQVAFDPKFYIAWRLQGRHGSCLSERVYSGSRLIQKVMRHVVARILCLSSCRAVDLISGPSWHPSHTARLSIHYPRELLRGRPDAAYLL